MNINQPKFKFCEQVNCTVRKEVDGIEMIGYLTGYVISITSRVVPSYSGGEAIYEYGITKDLIKPSNVKWIPEKDLTSVPDVV